MQLGEPLTPALQNGAENVPECRGPLRTAVRYNEKLSKCIMSAYGFLRTPISGFDLTVRPARTAVYTQALGMPVLTQAMIVAVAKSFDFLIGFIVGAWSDNLSTRFGRRKPFIAIAFPIGCVCMFLLVYPIPFASTALSSSSAAAAAPCADLIDADSPTSCSALKACLDVAIANGTLPPYTATLPPREEPAGLVLWFVIFYFLYYFSLGRAP